MDSNIIEVGDTITYTIPASELPVDPTKEYQGKVIRIDSALQQVTVTLLTPGYEGMEEPVAISQITGVTKP